MNEPRDQITNRSLVLRLIVLAVAMFGFGYLLVPLYDVFCEITGFGGRTNTIADSRDRTARLFTNDPRRIRDDRQ